MCFIYFWDLPHQSIDTKKFFEPTLFLGQWFPSNCMKINSYTTQNLSLQYLFFFFFLLLRISSDEMYLFLQFLTVFLINPYVLAILLLSLVSFVNFVILILSKSMSLFIFFYLSWDKLFYNFKIFFFHKNILSYLKITLPYESFRIIF